MKIRSVASLALAHLLAVGPAWAQTFTPDPVDGEAVRREGSLSWYTSTPVALAQQLIDAFQKGSGIKARPSDLDYVEDHNGDVKARFNQIFQ